MPEELQRLTFEFISNVREEVHELKKVLDKVFVVLILIAGESSVPLFKEGINLVSENIELPELIAERIER